MYKTMLELIYTIEYQDEVWLFGMDPTGDLALFNGGIKVWSTGTNNIDSSLDPLLNYAYMQLDGNFVVRNPETTGILWESGTEGNFEAI